jgi:hypothetical protein
VVSLIAGHPSIVVSRLWNAATGLRIPVSERPAPGTGAAVEGYDVIGSDDHKLGQVAAVDGDLLIVEGGLLRKTRHAVPLTFADADDGEQVVRLTISKQLVDESPPLENGEVDRQAVAEHYGLAQAYAEPGTEGYGELTRDDPAWTAEEQELRTGVEPAPSQRARMREGTSEAGPRGRQIIPPDAHDKV